MTERFSMVTRYQALVMRAGALAAVLKHLPKNEQVLFAKERINRINDGLIEGGYPVLIHVQDLDQSFSTFSPIERIGFFGCIPYQLYVRNHRKAMKKICVLMSVNNL